MSDQLSFPGLGAPPHLDSVFFAIFPPRDVAANIAERSRHLRAEHALTGRPLPAERFHVSLFHAGDYAGLPQDIVARLIDAAAAIALPPADIAFDRVVSFSGKQRPLVLRGGDGLADLIAFRQELFIAMKKAGLGRDAKPQFTPHVTLLYDERGIDEQAIEPIAWTVTEFVLVHSLLGRSQYILLGRWPLRG